VIHPYIPVSHGDRAFLLDGISEKSFDSLIRNIPEKFRLKENYDLPSAATEQEVLENLEDISKKNIIYPKSRSFLGGGLYRSFIPSIVDSLSGRSEFATAYTPYQAEVSQGTLLAIFEFQSYMATLCGMELANASLYDGATAAVEACYMARTARRGNLTKVYASVLLPPPGDKVYEDLLLCTKNRTEDI